VQGFCVAGKDQGVEAWFTSSQSRRGQGGLCCFHVGIRVLPTCGLISFECERFGSIACCCSDYMLGFTGSFDATAGWNQQMGANVQVGFTYKW
jgi:hypothetical protein